MEHKNCVAPPDPNTGDPCADGSPVFDFNNPELFKKVVAYFCFEEGYYCCIHRVWRLCWFNYGTGEYGKLHPGEWSEMDWDCDLGKDANDCRKCPLFELDMNKVFKEFTELKKLMERV